MSRENNLQISQDRLITFFEPLWFDKKEGFINLPLDKFPSKVIHTIDIFLIPIKNPKKIDPEQKNLIKTRLANLRKIGSSTAGITRDKAKFAAFWNYSEAKRTSCDNLALGNFSYRQRKKEIICTLDEIFSFDLDGIIFNHLEDLPEAKALAMAMQHFPDKYAWFLFSFKESEAAAPQVLEVAKIEKFLANPESAVATLAPFKPSGIGLCGTLNEQNLTYLRRMKSISNTDLNLGALFDLSANACSASAQNLEDLCNQIISEKISFLGSFEKPGSFEFVELYSKIAVAPQALQGKITKIESTTRNLFPNKNTILCGTSKIVQIGSEKPFVVIGERINPSGKKRLTEEIQAQKLDYILDQAKKQIEKAARAMVLDVNLTIADDSNAKEFYPKAIAAIQNQIGIPISIDSIDPEVVQAALDVTIGRPIINSITAEPERLNLTLDLAQEYGAALIGLTIDEHGLPQSSTERLKIAEKLLEIILAKGFSKSDLILDTLVMTAGAAAEQALQTLGGLALVKEKLGLNTILGISNISYGLPARSILNSAFLAMAMSFGLDAALVNPLDEDIWRSIYAASVLVGRDAYALNYIKIYSERTFRCSKVSS